MLVTLRDKPQTVTDRNTTLNFRALVVRKN
jgi:hypothetical protein